MKQNVTESAASVSAHTEWMKREGNEAGIQDDAEKGKRTGESDRRKKR